MNQACNCERCSYVKKTYPNERCCNCDRLSCESINFTAVDKMHADSKCKCWMCLDCVNEAMLLNHFQFWNSKKIEQCPRCHENIEDLLRCHFTMSMSDNSRACDMVPEDVAEDAQNEFRETHYCTEDEEESEDNCPECVRLKQYE